MLVIPALDLSKGKAVRLVSGRFKDYGSPWEWVKRFKEARRVHVVDLDAALGFRSNAKLRNALINHLRESGSEVQVGGGLRDVRSVLEVIRLGGIPIVGTLAYREPESLANLLKRGSVIVAVDSLDGKVRIKGWREDSGLSVEEAIEKFSLMGVDSFLVTAISRDGNLKGIDPLLMNLPEKFNGLKLIYAGGVSTLEDLILVKEAGYWGAVVGRALYETELLETMRSRGWII